MPPRRPRSTTGRLTTSRLAERFLASADNSSSFASFINRVNPDFVWGEHHKRIVPILEQWAHDRLSSGNRYLLIALPVRMGKSLMGSQLHPAWSAGMFARTNPPFQMIQAAYSMKFAGDMGDYAQAIIKSAEWRSTFPDLKMGKGNFETFQILRGSNKAVIWYSAGVGGTPQGKGADHLHFDDIIRDSGEAQSQTIRDDTWRWFNTDMLRRLQPGGKVVLIMTHRHRDDPIGRIMQLMKDPRAPKWDVICLPATLDEETYDNPLWRLGQKGPCPDWRKTGEALWPEWWPLSYLESCMIDPYTWDSEYQLRPRSSTTGVLQSTWFKNNMIDIEDPRIKNVFLWCRGVDVAVTPKTCNDKTAGVKVGLMKNGDMVISHVYEVRKAWHEARRDVLTHARLDGHNCFLAMGNTGMQSGWAEDMQATDPEFAPFMIEPISENASKLTRAQEWAGRVSHGRVWMVRAGWNELFFNAMDRFTGMTDDRDDDLIDAMSLAYRYFSRSASYVLSQGVVAVKKDIDTESQDGEDSTQSSPSRRHFQVARRTYY